MIKVKKIQSYYLVTKIKEHNQIKSDLLSLIDKIPQNSFEDITHTDWNLPRDLKREYLDYFYKIITPYINEMSSSFYYFFERWWRWLSEWQFLAINPQ